MSTADSQAHAREKIRVLLADDHPPFREGLSRLLGEESDVEVVAVVADGEEAVRVAEELSPDVVIMDVAMPSLNGIEATKQIKAALPNAAVVVLSAYDYDSYVFSAIEAGAAAYLMKSLSVDQLVSAIRAVHAGETVLDRTAARKLFARFSSTEDGATSKESSQRLHQRQLEVLRLAARGLSNKEIARELAVSERTIQSHLSNIFEKLGVNSRTEAVLRALKEGWITTDDLP